MKHIRISLIVALILGAMVALSSVRAAAADAATDAPAKKQRMTPEQRLDQTTKQLGLNDEQKAKLKTAMEAQTKARTELQKDPSFAALSQQEKRAKSRVSSDKFIETVNSFLTPEQKITFAASQQKGGKKGRQTPTP